METFVFNQLMAIIESREIHYDVYCYRDQVGHELDFLIENTEGRYQGIEVKAGARVDRKSFKHLEWFKENMLSEQFFMGIVLYTGREVLHFAETMWAVPICCLWTH